MKINPGAGGLTDWFLQPSAYHMPKYYMVFERINFILQDVWHQDTEHTAYNPSEALPQVHRCFRGTVVVFVFLITGRLLVDNNILES